MKKATLTALPARLLTVNAEATALRIKMGNAFELSGAFHNTLAAYAQGKVSGVRLTVRAQSPRLSEVYGIKGDLNTLGLSITANRDLTPTEKRKIEKALEFYLDNVTVQRTLKRDGKARAELRDRTVIHKETAETSIAGITKYVIAF